MKRHTLPNGGHMRVRARSLVVDLLGDTTESLLTEAGQAARRLWVNELFHDAEQVRKLDRRSRMSFYGSGGYFTVRFAKSYTPEDVAVWAAKLLLILREPANTHISYELATI